MDRFKNTQTQPWISRKEKKGTLNYPVAAATSNNAPIAALKTWCEKQRKWVKDENVIMERSNIGALSPGLMQSFHCPAHMSLCPKVEKYFKFKGSLPWDCIDRPDKSSYYAIPAGCRWIRREVAEEEMSGMQVCRGFSLLRKMLPLASRSVAGNCLNAIPPPKANTEHQSLQSSKATGGLALKKWAAFSRKKKNSSSGLLHYYHGLSHYGDVYCFSPLPGFLNVPCWKARTSCSEFWLEVQIISLLIPN